MLGDSCSIADRSNDGFSSSSPAQRRVCGSHRPRTRSSASSTGTAVADPSPTANGDVLGLLTVGGDALEVDYLHETAAEVGLSDLLERAVEAASEG